MRERRELAPLEQPSGCLAWLPSVRVLRALGRVLGRTGEFEWGALVGLIALLRSRLEPEQKLRPREPKCFSEHPRCLFDACTYPFACRHMAGFAPSPAAQVTSIRCRHTSKPVVCLSIKKDFHL